MAHSIEELVDNHQQDNRMVRVKREEVTLHKATGILREPISGTPTGVQQGLGETFYEDEVVPVRSISPLYLAALEDENHESHEYISAMIEFVEDEPSVDLAKRLGVPFEGYDEMDPEEIVRAMSVLPSATIAAIKQYESDHEARPEILTYSVGFGESPIQRQTGAVSSELSEETDETKAVRGIRTRQTPAPADEVVVPGEGVTGTGEGNIPHGSTAEGDSDSEDGEGGSTRATKKVVKRRSRSTRQGDADQGNQDSGDGSDGSSS